MIFFANDWLRFPTVKPDYTTKNESFMRIARLYKAMGIRNHTFMLALVNQDLVGVDPHDPYLSEEMKLAVSAEAKLNVWYFFREVMRVPAKSGGEPGYFEASRANIATIWLFLNEVLTWLILIRQTGKSFTVDSLINWFLNVRCSGTLVNILTKDDKLRVETIRRIKDNMDVLPPYLDNRSILDVDNSETISVKALDNWLKTHLSSSNTKLALNVGRGFSAALNFCDELPFIPNIQVALSAMLAAGVMRRDQARVSGEPNGSIFTTTAGKKDTKEGRYIYTKLSAAAIWNEVLYDAVDRDDLHNIVLKASKNAAEINRLQDIDDEGTLAVNITMNHLQLGKDDKWLLGKLKETMVTGEEADRDFFNRWTSGSLSSPFTVEESEMIRRSESDPHYAEITRPHGYIVRWYIPRERIASYMASNTTICSLDPSEASGGDDISMIIRDIKTGHVIAAGNYNESFIPHFANWYTELLIKYPKMNAIIERRSMGAAILDQLLITLPAHGIDPFRRLFNRIVNEPEQYPDEYKEISYPMSSRDSFFYQRYRKYFGFATSGGGITSRSDLYSVTLRHAVETCGMAIKDTQTIDQILGLVIKNGRIDHEAGQHDDMVIAWLLSHWFMTQGMNLKYYGIDSSSVLSIRTRANVKEATSDEIRQQLQQGELRKQLTGLLKDLKSTYDVMAITIIEKRIRELYSRLDVREDEFNSLDEVIKTINENKRQRDSRYRADSNRVNGNDMFSARNVSEFVNNVHRNQIVREDDMQNLAGVVGFNHVPRSAGYLRLPAYM